MILVDQVNSFYDFTVFCGLLLLFYFVGLFRGFYSVSGSLLLYFSFQGKIWPFLMTEFLSLILPSPFFSAVHLLCSSRVHDVNCIKQGINAWGSGSLVIADRNTDQRPLTAPWVFGLLLSALLH